MSEIKNDGGPAFPCAFPEMGGGMTPGMSLRDWFAGQALAALLSNPVAVWKRFPDEPVQDALAVADAMLAARDGAK